MVNDRTLRSVSDFTLTLSNVNVKIFDLLAFLVMLYFSSHCSHLEIVCGGIHFYKLQDYENIHGRVFFENIKKITEVSFHFCLQLCKTIFKRILSYEDTFVEEQVKREVSEDLSVCVLNNLPKVSILPSLLVVNLTKVDI